VSEPKFTPGPWRVDFEDDVRDASGEFIASFHRIAGPAGKYTANYNAQLTAAAPDLFAALVALLDKEDLRGGEGVEHVDDAYRAIRRALDGDEVIAEQDRKR
jgi:hypothetical protein